MKKRFLSLLMVLCLAATMVPGAFAADATMDESAFRNAVAQGGTVTMTGDVTLTSPLTINKAVVIDGTTAKYSITAPSGQNAVNVTAGDVVLQNLTINASDNGYGVHATGPDLTVANCVFNVTNRGISFYPTNGNGATLTVTNTKIYNSKVSDYDRDARLGDSRGIATGNIQAGKVTISGSQILGFGYSINAVVNPDSTGLRDGKGTEFNVTNTIIKGWSVLNLWSAATKFNFTNCTLVGINTSDQSGDGFAAIRANDGIYGGYTNKASVITIKGGSVISKQYSTALQTPFTVDKELQTEFVFEKYRNNLVNIEIYTTDTVAYVFTFYPGVDGDGYMASSKLQGYNDETVSVSGYSISALNTLSIASDELDFDFQEPKIVSNESWIGGNAA